MRNRRRSSAALGSTAAVPFCWKSNQRFEPRCARCPYPIARASNHEAWAESVAMGRALRLSTNVPRRRIIGRLFADGFFCRSHGCTMDSGPEVVRIRYARNRMMATGSSYARKRRPPYADRLCLPARRWQCCQGVRAPGDRAVAHRHAASQHWGRRQRFFSSRANFCCWGRRCWGESACSPR
jgi:hypothetical protein